MWTLVKYTQIKKLVYFGNGENWFRVISEKDVN